jgi:hypothetical protein
MTRYVVDKECWWDFDKQERVCVYGLIDTETMKVIYEFENPWEAQHECREANKRAEAKEES